MSKTFDIGISTAYGAAVRGGYAGTYEQFCADLARLADVLEEFLGFSVTIQTLAEGQQATASYENGVLSLGIPKGDTGNGIQSISLLSTVGLVKTYRITYTNGNHFDFPVADGKGIQSTALNNDYTLTIIYTDGTQWTSTSIRGAVGQTPNLRIGTVQTLQPGEGATATITGTPEDPILNFGIPKGNPGGGDANDITYNPESTYNDGTAGKAISTLNRQLSDVTKQYNILNVDYTLALGTWENGAFVAWNKRIASRYAIDVKKNDIITVLSTTLRWNLGIYLPGGQTTVQNTGWLEPSETMHTVVAQFDGKMFLIFAKTSGDTMSLSDYDAIVHIYNTASGHLESLTTANSIKIDRVDDDLTDIVNTQKFTLFDEAISLTTFADIPVNWPAGTYDFYASAFVSSDTDVNVCRVVLRSSNNTDIYTFDNARNVEINRVVTSDVPVATLRIYAGTTYSNSSGDTLTISQLSVRLRTALSNRMDFIEANIMQNRENIDQVEINQKFLSDLFLHDKFFSHLGIEQTSNIIIPPQSIADVARTKRLGFKALELNCRKTKDDQYVCIHGIQGAFGYQFTDINGNSVRDVMVNSMTLQEIKDGIRFKSNYQRYRTAPFTLQEMLLECKKLNIVPLIEFQPSYTDILEIADRIMGKDNYFVNIYNVNRSQANTNAPLSSWLAIADSSFLVNKCETSGGIYYAGINVTNSVYADFTDANWKDLADAVHLAGYKIGFLAGYASESLSQRLLNLGFDYAGSLWRINEIENGNLCNLFAGSDFVTGFNTNGTVTNGTLTLAEGNTITPKAQLNSVFLGGGSLHIAYSGSIRVQFGEYIDATFTNSDGSDQWFSTYFEESAPTFTITATAETIVYDITYKASEM